MTEKSSNNIAGKIISSLFGIFFLGMSIQFALSIIGEVRQEYQTRFWTETPCRIIQSEVAKEQNRSKPYCAAITYRYDYQGETYDSDQLELKPEYSGDYQKAQALIDRYPVDSVAVCYVNPVDPAQAILQHGSLNAIWALLFVTPFVLIGGALVLLPWWSKTGQAGKQKSVAPQSLTHQVRRGGSGCLIWFFGLFLLSGLGILYGMFVVPWLNYRDSLNWTACPCVIESSQVISHYDGDGTTYSIDILYRYTFNGIEHKSNRYDFFSGTTSGRRKYQAMVNRYPAGSEGRCYVDPDDPSQAVLEREWLRDKIFLLIPMVFVIAGLAGIYFVLRSRGSRNKSRMKTGTGSYGTADQNLWQDYQNIGTITLNSYQSRLKDLVLRLVFALFWNGIVSIFVVHVVGGHMKGRPEWFLTLFLIPFVLIGLFLLFWLFHGFLAVFNTAIQLSLYPAPIRLGAQAELRWEITHVSYRLKRLIIRLEGREEVTVQEGSGKRRRAQINRSKFYDEILFEQACDAAPIGSGQAVLAIPADLMHTFKCGNNRIVWELHVEGLVDKWPDIHDKYLITILPISE